MDQEATLENWIFLAGRLHGNVFDHPRFSDGSFVHTSNVKPGEEVREGNIVRTANTAYFLGKPASEKSA